MHTSTPTIVLCTEQANPSDALLPVCHVVNAGSCGRPAVMDVVQPDVVEPDEDAALLVRHQPGALKD